MYIIYHGIEKRAADLHLSIASFLQDFPEGNWQIRCGFSRPFQLDLFELATDCTRPFAGQSDALQHLDLAFRALATNATPYM